MTKTTSSGWVNYKKFSQETVPELGSSNPPQLLTLLDNITYAGETVFLDFEGLFDRLRNDTGRHCGTLLTLSDLFSTYPTLDDIYSAHYHLLEAVVAATRAFWRYLACRRRIWDRTKTLVDDDLETALHDFYKEDARVRTSIGTMAACWNETRHRLPYELGAKLRTPARLDWVRGVVLPWLPDSKLHVLRTDVPNIIKKAEWHLANFRHLYESLEGCVKQIESNTSRETASQAAEALLPPLFILFTHYRFSLAHGTGPILSVSFEVAQEL
ncbi:hypothetical protein C8R44DRAFT_926352 [Mycena epipterygia]|nr:hypothetical protein C8R44DRAFT_926352 [Mycena epipterygia]